MPAVDFTAWVTPNLDVTLAGHDYSCPPPSVADARLIVALAVISETQLGLVPSPPDPDVLALAESQTDSLQVVTLGREIVDAMTADGVDGDTIARVGFYALHYWARGKAMADWIAQLMWDTSSREVADTAPKARRRTKSGPSTA
ncbi:MAG: DUF7426 family protein [Rhodoglobus sp.]